MLKLSPLHYKAPSSGKRGIFPFALFSLHYQRKVGLFIKMEKDGCNVSSWLFLWYSSIKLLVDEADGLSVKV